MNLQLPTCGLRLQQQAWHIVASCAKKASLGAGHGEPPKLSQLDHASIMRRSRGLHIRHLPKPKVHSGTIQRSRFTYTSHIRRTDGLVSSFSVATFPGVAK
eukprot:6191780-Pleurochrysis_carterae.AAC.1